MRKMLLSSFLPGLAGHVYHASPTSSRVIMCFSLSCANIISVFSNTGNPSTSRKEEGNSFSRGTADILQCSPEKGISTGAAFCADPSYFLNIGIFAQAHSGSTVKLDLYTHSSGGKSMVQNTHSDARDDEES